LTTANAPKPKADPTAITAVFQRMRGSVCELDVQCYNCHESFTYHPRSDPRIFYCPHCGCPQTSKQLLPSMKAVGMPLTSREED
jgi:hypothetical protein